MKELLRTTDPVRIAMAMALLEGEGITAFEWDVHMSILDGSLGILPRRLAVADADWFLAQAILRDNGLWEE
ncbi:putative signal transducing protein [Rhodobacter capsulatus]|jgi:hypothetical protein|uniref:DUF2007 domain-containing protein n=2 Tax=Rhodobacter TaxID=1060 RepID=D5ARA2_RHOCB|nr:DUF2007 domain-containing protein [Rhodobacter capsulatus]ADE86907.1 conserved hypothetical protein [Rhodobacter capsulatus SB 1003]ETD00440.1 hypothetical protein U714_17355 [Rhodobacter capsulatus DE442]ETD74780.1 hypothetical protein U717_17320 [Rhodobacter capsulatus R121]ETD80503.1 hypothetical protein U716_12375 [Rhodobacter capsulatus B6]ETD80786.1 hypothetical protein U703_16905 [Rhodobacter capsulatus YW1]